MKREIAIKKVKKAIFLVYFFLIFEGVLRKWLLPELSKAIFFIKDPIVIYVYYISFKYKLFPKSFIFKLSMMIIVLFTILSILQVIITDYTPIVAAYGLRMYFLYMPLAFVIYSLFDKKDIRFYIKFTLLISIPIAILILIQFLSPPTAFINKNAGTEAGHVFQIIAGIVRPYGTFSFVIGQSFFVPSVLMFLLIYKEFYAKHKDALLSKLTPFIWLSYFVMLALSGSRTTLANNAIIFLTIYIYSIFFIKRKSSLKIIIGAGLILFTALFILNYYFYDIVEIYIQRQNEATASEGSASGRGLTMILEFIKYLQTNIPTFGYGIGAGTSGGVALLQGSKGITLAEYDLSRNVMELGVFFALIFIAFRVYLTLFIIYKAIKNTIETKKYSSIVAMAYIFPTILFGQITGNGTVMVYAWFFFGLFLAIEKNSRIENE